MLTIDYRSKDPIYLQIKNEIARLVVLGVYLPDTPLPSVRTLATQLGINPNTIQKAYRLLEEEGITYSAAGRGSFVAGAEAARAYMKQTHMADCQAVIKAARLAGVTLQELQAMADEIYEEGAHD